LIGFDWFVALLLFVLVAGFTPGPNNIIALSIGFNYGYKKVIPHILGVSIGFPVMLMLIGTLLYPFMKRFEMLFTVLRYASILYIFYLAYKIATSNIDEKELEGSVKKPISFFQSLAFQWINPKAWAGALSTVTIYIPSGDEYLKGLVIASLVSAITIVGAISTWALIGKKIKKFIKNPFQVRLFNVIMSILLVISVLIMMKGD